MLNHFGDRLMEVKHYMEYFFFFFVVVERIT